jgi:hypothetical protein
LILSEDGIVRILNTTGFWWRFASADRLMNRKEESGVYTAVLLCSARSFSQTCGPNNHECPVLASRVKAPVLSHISPSPPPKSAPQQPIERDRIMASPSGQGLDTPQVQFVLKFFDHLSARNLGAAFSLLSETLVYEMWPASLAHSPRTKSEYKALLDTNPDRDVKVWLL